MIEIQELKNLNENQILDRLLDEKTKEFEIYVPKSTQLYFSETSDVVEDYLNLAYSGYLLKETAEEFWYQEVAPDIYESILFKVKPKDFSELAIALKAIADGYVNKDESEDDEPNSVLFYYDAEQHATDVKEGKVEAACPYFLTIFHDLNKDLSEEKEDD